MRTTLIILFCLFLISPAYATYKIIMKDGTTFTWSNYFEEKDNYCTHKSFGKFCVSKSDVASIKKENDSEGTTVIPTKGSSEAEKEKDKPKQLIKEKPEVEKEKVKDKEKLSAEKTFTFEEKSSRPIVLSLPDLNWALEINAIGFSMEDFEIAPHGNATRFQAANKKTGVVMSGFLEKAPKKGNAKDCRSYYWSKAQKSPFPKTDIKMSESGEIAIVEYFVKEYMGRELNQKNLNAYLAESDYWIDIHLSKTDYKPGDQQLFEAVLSGVRIKKNYKPDSLMLFHYGNLFYWQKKYSKAIPYYQQALNLENKDKTMPKALWFVLVDQLGMSYGISGDIENAKKIYNSAISKEPEYPMFYYNLACACAESNDLDGAIRNLKLAYKYKKNMLPGEILPNPRNDSSFKKYINTEKFKAELNQIE